MSENERQNVHFPAAHPAAAESSRLPAGQFGKAELFFVLRPDGRGNRSRTIYGFLTPARIELCGYTAEGIKRVRIFSPEACCTIRTELQKIGFL